MVTAALLEAVRPLRAAAPALAVERLVARLREQRPDLDAGAEQVGEALRALEAEESEGPTATAAPTAADEGASGAPSQGVSLACVGCGVQPWQLGKKKFQVCPWCAADKLPATFWCGTDCPANPEAWRKHKEWHKDLKKMQESWKDGGVKQQQNRKLAEELLRLVHEPQVVVKPGLSVE